MSTVQVAMRPVVVIAAESLLDGTYYTDPVSGFQVPLRTFLQVELGRVTDPLYLDYAWGKLVMSSTDFTSLNSVSVSVGAGMGAAALKPDWSQVTPDKAVFKFRVAYQTLADWLLFALDLERGPDGAPNRWRCARSYYRAVDGLLEKSLPVVYFDPKDVHVTP